MHVCTSIPAVLYFQQCTKILVRLIYEFIGAICIISIIILLDLWPVCIARLMSQFV